MPVEPPKEPINRFTFYYTANGVIPSTCVAGLGPELDGDGAGPAPWLHTERFRAEITAWADRIARLRDPLTLLSGALLGAASVDLPLGDATKAWAERGREPTVSFEALVQLMSEADRAGLAAPEAGGTAWRRLNGNKLDGQVGSAEIIA
jgi:hypothetical protein